MRVKGGLADGAHHLARRHQRGRPRQHRRCTCSAYPTCHFVTEGSYARVNEVCNKLFFRHVPVPDTIHMEERWGTNIVVAVAPNDTRILHIADPLGYVHIVVTRGEAWVHGSRVSVGELVEVRRRALCDPIEQRTFRLNTSNSYDIIPLNLRET